MHPTRSPRLRPIVPRPRHLLAALALWANCVVAQGDTSLDEIIELDPFTVDSGNEAIPPITIKRRGDYLLLSLEIVDDSRIRADREKEIYTTIEDMVERAIPKGIILYSGEFNLDARHQRVELNESSQRADTTQTQLYAKYPLDAESDVVELSDRLRSYATSIRGAGRTEIFPGEIGLSIVHPEKYRYDVIAAIAQDLSKTKELMGNEFRIAISGLDQRLRWRRVGLAEVEIYLPYEFYMLPLELNDW